MFELATNPAVLQFIRSLPTLREEALHHLLRYAEHRSLLGFGMFAVFERSSGAFTGEVGLADFQLGLGINLTVLWKRPVSSKTRVMRREWGGSQAGAEWRELSHDSAFMSRKTTLCRHSAADF